MPRRLTLVGELERPDHEHLPAEDKCYFWGEYTPHKHTSGKLWDFSPTNQLISNLKKGMSRRGKPDWRYKQEAIKQVAQAFAVHWKWKELLEKYSVALIPIPSSKAKTDADYDPRMLLVLEELSRRLGAELDIRDCLSFSGAYAASHKSEEKRDPDRLYEDLTFDAVAGKVDAQPDVILIFDDMLTTGAHYAAVTRHLREHFPDARLVGVFVSRRLLPDPFADAADDFDVLDD